MTLGSLIQRGFDSTIANWPLLLIRVAGSVAITLVVLAAIIPIVAFAIYSGTMTGIESVTTTAAMIDWLLSNAVIIAALFLVLTLILAVAIAVHSFITGGVAGIFLDADRIAPREQWTRRQLAAFRPDSWMRHGLQTWWKIFIIYNLTWGIWSVILLLPLLLMIPLMMGIGESGAAAAIGCVVVGLWLGFAFVGSIFVHLWTQLAILDCVRERAILTPLRRGLSIFFGSFLKIIALVILSIAVTFGIAGLSIAAQFGFEIGMNLGELALLLIPVQVVFSLLQTVISVFVNAWLMACFATIVNESVAPSPRGAPLATPPATA